MADFTASSAGEFSEFTARNLLLVHVACRVLVACRATSDRGYNCCHRLRLNRQPRAASDLGLQQPLAVRHDSTYLPLPLNVVMVEATPL